MIISEFENIAITGIACCVPDHEEDLSAYREIFGEESVEKFAQTTGVQRRRIAGEKQTASDMAYISAEKILKEKSVDPQTIGALIFVTQTPDYRLPSTAFVLQARLGLPVDCICYDVNLGCSGYTFGLHLLASLMKSSNISKGLLLFGDTANKFIAPTDKSACMLFGDAGGATLLEMREGESPLRMTFRSDGSAYKAVVIPAGAYRNMYAGHESKRWSDDCERTAYDLNMNGTDVFAHMIAEAPKLLKEYMAAYEKTLEDYDYVVLHQANAFILKQVAKRIKCPSEKVLLSMDRYGNTSVASIPLSIVDACTTGYIRKEQVKYLMCGLGGGLSLGVVDAYIDTSAVLPMIASNEYFDDHIIR